MKRKNYFVVFRFDTYRPLYKFRFDTWGYLSWFRFDTYLSAFCTSLGFVSTHLLVLPLHVTVFKAVELKDLRVENTRSCFSPTDNPCKPTHNRYLTQAQRLLKAMPKLCLNNACNLLAIRWQPSRLIRASGMTWVHHSIERLSMALYSSRRYLGESLGGIESQTLLSLANRSPPLVHINSKISQKIVAAINLVIAKTIEKKDLRT